MLVGLDNRSRTFWDVAKGPDFAAERKRFATELTKEMLDRCGLPPLC